MHRIALHCRHHTLHSDPTYLTSHLILSRAPSMMTTERSRSVRELESKFLLRKKKPAV